MTRLLLDTHILLWWLGDDPKLPDRHRDAIADSRNDVFVSAVTVWEIAIKQRLGKLDAPDDIVTQIAENAFTALPIGVDHAHAAAFLPEHHADPFDRMLIAQAALEHLVLASVDRNVARYGIPLL